MALREYEYDKEPVVSVVKKILSEAINTNASDIHFDPTKSGLSIKFRVNGNLHEYTNAPDSFKANILTRVKILAGMNITDSMTPQTGNINFEFEGKTRTMRASSLPTCHGEKVVVSINNYKSNIKNLSKIGINPEDTHKIKNMLRSNQGIILLTGTSGSGKTTTMYAMLKEISNKSLNIISIEDPVKMQIDGIHQVEIAPEKGLTYKNIIKHSLFQDPNVICIDHLVNDDIARDVIRVAITGRLVISSLYTKNAFTTIDTLLNMDIENYLLASNINGIISQRLVKELCPNCKESKRATEYEKNVIKKITGVDVEELCHPHGCDECQDGYINQFPIVEVIEITDEVKSAITNKKDRNVIRDLLYKNNHTILVDGFNHVIEGDTSFDEIIRVIDVKADFKDEEKDIKDYIFGHEVSSTDELISDDENIPKNIEKHLVIDEDESYDESEIKVSKKVQESIIDDDDEDDDEDDFGYNNFKHIS